MQQALYNSINGSPIQTAKTNTTIAGSRRAGLARRLAQKWDLVGVLALMASSAAYGIFAIAYVI